MNSLATVERSIRVGLSLTRVAGTRYMQQLPSELRPEPQGLASLFTPGEPEAQRCPVTSCVHTTGKEELRFDLLGKPSLFSFPEWHQNEEWGEETGFKWGAKKKL